MLQPAQEIQIENGNALVAPPDGPGYTYIVEEDLGPGFHELPVEMQPTRLRRAARGLGSNV